MKKFVVFRKSLDGSYEQNPTYMYESEKNDQTSAYRSHMLAEPNATSFELPDGIEADVATLKAEGNSFVVIEDAPKKQKKEKALADKELYRTEQEKAAGYIKGFDKHIDKINAEITDEKTKSVLLDLVLELKQILTYK